MGIHQLKYHNVFNNRKASLNFSHLTGNYLKELFLIYAPINEVKALIFIVPKYRIFKLLVLMVLAIPFELPELNLNSNEQRI